jgi:hypothetical protein
MDERLMTSSSSPLAKSLVGIGENGLLEVDALIGVSSDTFTRISAVIDRISKLPKRVSSHLFVSSFRLILL